MTTFRLLDNLQVVNSHENCTIPRHRGHEGSKLFDRYLVFGDETWRMGKKNSKIGNTNINNFLRYDTEEL